MSPEIRNANRDLIASVIDETGMHATTNGKPLYVNVDGIDAYNDRQTIILEAEEIGGRRVLGLTQEGKGRSSDPKRGDLQKPEIYVTLLDKPIRVSYSGRVKYVWHESIGLGIPGHSYDQKVVYKETHRNPRWIRNHGRR